MDGFDMTGAIREIEAANSEARTPIIAITANALHGEAERCKAAGMDDYLSKPVVLTNLNRMLKQWLSNNVDTSIPSRAGDAVTVADNIPTSSEAAVEPEVMVDVFGVDDRALFSDMMRLFVEKSGPDVGCLRDALQSKDNEAIVAIAHKLKAAARTIGANDLADLCDHIQRAGESGELRDHRIIGEEINTRFNLVQQFVEDYARS